MEYNKKNTSRRPKEVSDEHFKSEWERIFGQKNKEKEEVKEEEIQTGVLEVDPEMKKIIDEKY